MSGDLLAASSSLGYLGTMRFGSPFLLIATALLLPSCGEKSEPEAKTTALPADHGLAKSSECADCHQEITDAWHGSHHQLAQRDTGAAVEGEAFNGRRHEAGGASWSFTGGAENPHLAWQDEAAEPIESEVPMAIGLTPLVQYLTNTGDGRYQVPDMAWDVDNERWYSIFDDYNRRPDEWGHWTGRGMNWNSQCAYCHLTGYEKNHDVATDRYASKWVEQGVGCAQCHGPSSHAGGGDHCLIDPAKKYTKEQWTHSCATCHSRRSEFDEKFTIGDSFHDHYSLSLPDQPGLWHPDGQQLDEVYKFTSLMLSRMGHKGIGCTDCHDPHTATPIGGDAAVRSNALCMTCHGGGTNEAVVIDPSTHLNHAPGTAGASCVDCHMPKKNYMGIDDRSDHRFPRPDPLLTKELGVPNACNDCHDDQSLDWQIEWTHRWYGEAMNAVSRARSRAIHAAQNASPGALGLLISTYDAEEIDAWQATMLRLMEPWAADSRVASRANAAAQKGGPLARAAAAAIVTLRGEAGPVLEKLLADPLKAVRTEAAWGALELLPPDHPAVEEAIAISRHQADQPAGAMRMARIAMVRRDLEEAEKWFKRAVDWDRASPAPRRDFAVFLSGLGRTADAVEWLEEAAELSLENAEIHYLTALAYAELGQTEKAEAKLRDTVRIEPNFSRAWYNLGLLQAGQGRPAEAIASLRRAAESDPTGADAPYARATIHLRLGQVEDAIEAASDALRRAPDHVPSQNLLRELGR